MDLPALKALTPGLAEKSHYDKILIFGWWLHVHKNKPAWAPADIARCYDDLHIAQPSSFGGYLQGLVKRDDLIAKNGQYRLETRARERLDIVHGQTQATIEVSDKLAALAAKFQSAAERAYYEEALICYRYGSRRAAVVMTWNIAFAHLCDHILDKRLADFNTQWQQTYPGMHKKKIKTVASMEDFNDKLKEAETLTIARDADIITTTVYNFLHTALGRRNAAAHPSNVIIEQIQLDAYLLDLINNAIAQIA